MAEPSFNLWQMLVFLIKISPWGDTWFNLTEVASAIGYHGNQCSQIAALTFGHQKCIADNNKWLWFLQSENLISRELIKKCSELPGMVMGIPPLLRCPPVEEKRFSDWE